MGLNDIAAVFLKLGAMSYGGTAILGIMHAEIVERLRWLSNERYLDGIGLVNMLPGPPAVQLAVYIGYHGAGWRGGVLAGFCFMLPAFFILLGLTFTYSAYGSIGVVQNAFYGMVPAVLAIFAAALFRLGKSALKSPPQVAIAVIAGALVGIGSIGIATTLLLGACAGVALHHSRLRGLVAAAVLIGALGIMHVLDPGAVTVVPVDGAASLGDAAPSMWQLALFFLKVSAFTFGGGIAILAFIQEYVVNQVHWLSAREFLDGLALGQLTPGPTLMIAAFVGFKVAGVFGAVVSALAIFAPAFILMLAALPVMARIEHLLWIKPAMSGISATVIGCLVVTLLQLLPPAAPDAFSLMVLLATTCGLCVWRAPPLPVIVGAALLGIVAKHLLTYSQ